jgi:hypothetical protein
MTNLKYFKPENMSLKNHPSINEKWLQARIAEDPSILGLGELILKDEERVQPTSGRLDLLLQDPETLRRYELEIQLGKTDESHIVRTIEYWDIERRRYPQYDHCAVIIAEDITSRFLNVISLFNGFIPLVAIQLKAIKIDNQIGLVFTKVLDELPLGLVDEDEIQEVTDRTFWEEKRGTKQTVKLVDRMLELLHTIAPEHELKYNKFYIGLAKEGKADNVVRFVPQRSALRLHVPIKESEEVNQRLDEAGIDVLDYDRQWKQYRIKLKGPDIKKHEALLIELMQASYDSRH